MRKLLAMPALLMAAVMLVGVGPATAGKPSPKPASAGSKAKSADDARGGIKMTIHTHSANDPMSPSLLFPSDRLSYNFAEGESFSYSSRPCGASAPFNDLGLNFTPDYPGVDDDADGTAPVRHRIQGTITDINDDKGRVEGTITTVLCVRQGATQTESEHVIVTDYWAKFRRVSNDEVRISGRFRISPTRSTGTFEDLTGHGSLQGSFTCLGPATCQQLGHFTDFVGFRGDPTAGPGEIKPGLVGSYRDPTVETR